MKKILILVCLLFISAVGFAQDSPEIVAAADWLELADAGKYDESWAESAPLLQNKIKEKDWLETMEGMRQPLGAALSRRIVQAEERKRLPGFPRGKYMIFLVETNFANKSGAIESVTVKKDDDVWRVVGYIIQ